ncbi:MAG: hypothetical protein GQF41_2260 [Candidatus Rifleibacterium amylolyticum]|jgi:uncharacterized phage infection (PIP) family protein YhgE|nr:MAG: hypothetical protein GQF41_2260 [Candidatus Rifleibacterium amylolyticum]NLF95545.1 hypothetical protein [Candidatus Riflebacteria bacterium]
MKKFLTTLAIVLAISVVSPVFAQTEGAPKAKRERVGKMGREVNAEQMIKNIEERKAGILENIALRNTKLNERLAKFGERIDQLSARMEKARSEKPTEKAGTEKPTMSEEQLKERKEKVTTRYNEFKKNLEQRKTQVFERIENVRSNVLKRIEQLPEADRDRVKTALENAISEVKSEAEKLEKEAKEKIEATYQKLMAI